MLESFVDFLMKFSNPNLGIKKHLKLNQYADKQRLKYVKIMSFDLKTLWTDY